MTILFNPLHDLIIIAIIASIVVLYLSYKHFFSLKETNILFVTRSLVLSLVIFLIFDPTLEERGDYNKKLPWQIYIDNSLSMKYHKYPSETSYKNGLQDFLKKIEKKVSDIEIFSFSSSLDTVKEISKLNLDKNSTNLGLIFDKINYDYQKNLAGVILITDGQINEGPSIQEFYNDNYKIPFYIVGIGHITPMLDISIQSIKSPPLITKGENANIDVLVTSFGTINERVNINLFDEKNKLIGSKLINVGGNEANETVRFQINPNKIGENNFLVKCSALPDEINIQNNQQKITIHVMKDQYNIALVTGAPSYNTKVLKNYLNNQGNNEIDHFIIDDKNFKQKIKNFLEKKYEVIIFDNNPVPESSQKWESVARVFAKKIISHNSSLFVVPGPETDISSLNKYLKIIDLEAEGIEKIANDNLEWEFSSTWFDLFSINDDEPSKKIESLPPQIPAFKLLNDSVDKKKEFYANYILENGENPLLILGEKKNLRYAIWNSIDLASLKFMLSNYDINFLFDNSLKKITNWLMKKSYNKEFVFRTDKNLYQHGESVTLSGISSDLSDNNKIKDIVVELYQDKKYIGSKPLFFDLNENIYKANFWAPKPGKINYIVKMARGVDNYEISGGSFKVQESHIELNKIFLNENKLSKLSASSGGIFKKWEKRDDIINLVEDVEVSIPYISFYTFRHNYVYISIIILLLFFEWFYRKRIGLN